MDRPAGVLHDGHRPLRHHGAHEKALAPRGGVVPDVHGHAARSRGGSFLARSGADVFNTFVLASPSGHVYTHDKDFPTTNIETSVYAGGEDDEFVKEHLHRWLS